MPYKPNQISKETRDLYLVLSIGLLLYVLGALYFDSLYIPGSRYRRNSGIVFHGESLWIVCSSILCIIANLVSVIADHYDRRNNERSYNRFAMLTFCLGLGLFFLALILDATVYHKITKP
jgi:formate hydrogenlyase subunit 3/multisubunit Na+/H+ antiporter MnhD subunit